VTSHRLLLVAVLAALLVPPAALGSQHARKAAPSLTLSVNLGGAIEVVLGNGTRFRGTGTLVPPGQYLLIVHSEVPDDRDIFHVFHISGPGVEVSSDLLPCENPREIFNINLRPSSTYVYEDSRHPELGRVVFTTAATGSSAETSSSAVGHKAGGFSGSVSNESEIGSKALKGVLAGTVPATGRPTLLRSGKAVSLLKTGRYRIAVDDKTAKLGFTLQRVDKQPLTVTRPAFVGKRTVTLDLKPGKWTFYAGAGAGAKQYFTVLS
jgi:hypothetical protein